MATDPADHAAGSITVSVSDAESFATLFTPLIDLIITIHRSDADMPVDAYLDAISFTDGEPVLECRWVDEGCIPIGPTRLVNVATITHLHIW